MKNFIYESEIAAKSCQTIYRMGGLRHVCLYLRDTLNSNLHITRVNSIITYNNGRKIINLADTNQVSVSNKNVKYGEYRPLILHEKARDAIFINDLTKFQENFKKHCKPGWEDTPFLHHSSLIRIPLELNEQTVFLLNFWSNKKNIFSHEDVRGLMSLTKNFLEELSVKLSDLDFSDSPGDTHRIHSIEKLKICPSLISLRNTIENLACFENSILIMGETGVGKEVVADAIYQYSGRKNKPFIKVNCGAIPENLIDSLLFGHEKGSFTGAVSTGKGYFEQANGGTLFLDELGEMSEETQIRLLRILDSGELRRVGSHTVIPVDVRIIAATHDDLPRKVEKGLFRKDLWFRLSVFHISVPPLRERREDIRPLLSFFLSSFMEKYHITEMPVIADGEMEKLYMHGWPGNVREFAHMVERSMLKYYVEKKQYLKFEIEKIEERHIDPDRSQKIDSVFSGWPTLREVEDNYIKLVVSHCNGKMTGNNSATGILGIHYTTLKSRLKEIGGTSIRDMLRGREK